MNQTPSDPWIHIGECPVCVNGICRVRSCRGNDQESIHFYAVCDECDATWVEPDTATELTFADAQNASCPVCNAKMYGKQARWARAEELRGSCWEEHAIYEVSSSIETSTEDLLTSEDVVRSLDAPPGIEANGEFEAAGQGGQDVEKQGGQRCRAEGAEADVHEASDSEVYGQDDPKPGC